MRIKKMAAVITAVFCISVIQGPVQRSFAMETITENMTENKNDRQADAAKVLAAYDFYESHMAMLLRLERLTAWGASHINEINARQITGGFDPVFVGEAIIKRAEYDLELAAYLCSCAREEGYEDEEVISFMQVLGDFSDEKNWQESLQQAMDMEAVDLNEEAGEDLMFGFMVLDKSAEEKMRQDPEDENTFEAWRLIKIAEYRCMKVFAQDMDEEKTFIEEQITHLAEMSFDQLIEAGKFVSEKTTEKELDLFVVRPKN